MSKRQKEVEGAVDIEALMEKYGDNILRLCYLYLLSAGWGTGGAVSYTHLTLPTTPYV